MRHRTVSTLTPAELRRQLAGDGIWLRTGPFVTRLRSPIPSVAAGLGLLYADAPLEPPAFADFHVEMRRPGGLRRLWHPQVRFVFDGHQPFTPLPLNHAFPALEWGMNWCVAAHAYGWLVIHAAVIERNGRAAILPAPPGSGKSTLCAALVHRGWRLLSDELTMVRLGTGAIVPNPRPVSLKNASIDIIRAYLPGCVLSPPVRDTDKGTVAHLKPPREAVARAHEPAAPGWIVYPKFQAGAAPTLTPVARSRSFMRVAENAFNYSRLGVHGFDTLAGLLDHSDSYEFTYSRLDDAVAVFERLAEGA
jgi:HprK-related kinase A